MELVRERGVKVTYACRLFGYCRQAFYQLKAGLSVELGRERLIMENARAIRGESPGIGGYKLWVMLRSLFGPSFVPGRDSFYRLLRRHGLALPPRKPRHTTFSNHRYHKWKNLVKGFVPTAANQLWVADITYIDLAGGGVCYLHLITDAYSRKIIGWALADTLRAAISLQVLEQAIGQALPPCGGERLDGLVHHSDRGVQYCCDDYVAKLREHGISISMTEDYKPTDNAVAERVNGIIKAECVNRRLFNTTEEARDVIGRYIHFYNHFRPHMSLGYKVPAIAHRERGGQKKMWKRKEYKGRSGEYAGNDVSLQGQVAGPDESPGQNP